LVFFQLFLEDVEVSGMEDHDCIFLCDEKDLAFFHLLAKGHPFCQLKAVALNPLASGLKTTVDFILNFP